MENEKPKKKVSSLFITVCLVLSIFTVMSITFTTFNVRAELYWSDEANRTVDDTRWIENEEIFVQGGNLTITSTGELILGNNVTLKIINPDPPNEHKYGIIIESGGKFIVNSTNADTEIVSDPDYPTRTYHFTNSGTLDFLGATVERVFGNPGDKTATGGIRNLPGSSCTLTNCNIMDADTHSLYVKGTSRDGAELNIANCVLTNTTSGVLNGTGILIEDNSTVVIDSVTIKNTTEDGIKCYNANDVTIQNGTAVQNCFTNGISLQDSNVSIKDSFINNNSGNGITPSAFVSGNTNVTVDIEGNDIRDNTGSGIYYTSTSDNSNITISNNTISSNGVEVLFSDDIENGQNGWSVSLYGHWEIVNDDYHSATHSWRYHIGDEDYDNGTRNYGILRTPTIDLSNVGDATLTFWSWYETETNRSQEKYDLRNVTVYVNASCHSTYQIWSEEPKVWYQHQINLADFVGLSIDIRFEFDTIDDENNSYQGWYIDDVEVLGAYSTGFNGAGIYSYGNFQSTIDNNTIGSNVHGIISRGVSDNCVITNNTINSNMYSGIWANNSSPTISYNNITEHSRGIFLEYNSNVTMSNNDFFGNNKSGINYNGSAAYILNSSPVITENYFLWNKGAIIADMTSNITVTGNMFIENSGLLWVNHQPSPDRNSLAYGGAFLISNSKGFFSRNYVSEGANVIVYFNSSGEISHNYIILYNGTCGEGFTPVGTNGIMTSQSSNINIINNTILGGYYDSYYGYYGIKLMMNSTNCTILDNTISSNGTFQFEFRDDTYSGTIVGCIDTGIKLYEANSCIIENNTINSAKPHGNFAPEGGIYLYGSSYNNTITNNTLSDNICGLNITDSSNNNSIYHNNFINNTIQAYDNGLSNSWDNGYPSGGNYWSDYNGTDTYGGPGQNLSGSDGIGDTPYDIDNDLGGALEPKDNYPMMYENRDTYTYWAKTYGTTSTENLYWKGIHQTSDGGYIVAGFTNSGVGSDDDFLVIKLNETGNVMWNKTYGGPSNDEANAIIQTSDGGYVVVGYTFSYGAGGADMWVVKLNEWGNITWNCTYGGSSTDSANSIVQTSDRGYMVAGYTRSYGVNSYADYWVLKLESDGTVEWDRTFGGSSNDYADSIIQTSDGNYTVGGLSYSYRTGASGADYWILHIESDGDIIWNKTYGFSNSDDGLNSIMQTSDGGYIAGGYTYTGGDADYWVLKLESDGDVTWQYRYGGDYNDFAVVIDETSDGEFADSGFVVAGYTQSYGFDVGSSYDCWVLKLYSNGTVNWQKTYGGDGDDYAWSIEETSDGGLIVAGYTDSSFSAGGDDCWVLKLGPNGGTTFDYDSGAYTSNTDATAQSTSCTVSTASTGVSAPIITPGTTTFENPVDTNCIVGTQATPSYGWYRKD